MTTKKRRLAMGSVAALLTVSGVGLAAAGGTDPKLEKLPKEVQVMHCLDGEWQANAKFTAGEKTSDVKVRMVCKPTSNGYGVSCETQFKGFPSGDQQETDLFGYDPTQNKYHWFVVSTMGEAHDHVAEVSKNGALDWVYNGQQDGKPLVEHLKMNFADDHKHFDFNSQATLGGAVVVRMSAAVTKR